MRTHSLREPQRDGSVAAAHAATRSASAHSFAPMSPRCRPDCLRWGGIFATLRTECADVDWKTPMLIPCREMRCFRSVACRFGQLAQLVRALRSHRRGHRFESCAAHLASPDRAADSAPLVETFGFEPPCDRVAEVCVANLEVRSAELVGECPSHLVQMWAGSNCAQSVSQDSRRFWNSRGHVSAPTRSITFSAVVRRLAPGRAAIGTTNRAAKTGRLRGSWPLRFNAAGRR